MINLLLSKFNYKDLLGSNESQLLNKTLVKSSAKPLKAFANNTTQYIKEDL